MTNPNRTAKLLLLLIVAYVSITGLFGVQWFWNIYTALEFVVFGVSPSMDEMINTEAYELAISIKDPRLCKDVYLSPLLCNAVITENINVCTDPEIFDVGLGGACLRNVCKANPRNNDLACVIARLRR